MGLLLIELYLPSLSVEVIGIFLATSSFLVADSACTVSAMACITSSFLVESSSHLDSLIPCKIRLLSINLSSSFFTQSSSFVFVDSTSFILWLSRVFSSFRSFTSFLCCSHSF